MKASSRILALCLLPLGMCGVALAQQTLQFTNTTPPVQVTLSPSSTLGIAANGNVTASCVLDAQNADRCQGMPAGGGGSGNGPTVGLTASYSAPADANNEYPAGTIVTLPPTVVGNPPPAEACVQVLVAGPGDSGWGGTAMLPPFGARQATVNTPDATYQFRLRCFSPGGVGESAVITVNTQPGIPPPPGDDCTAEQQAAADASHPGYTRASAPEIGFSSNPVLPQDEVLSRLIFNRSMGELSPLQLAQLAGAAAELVGGGGGGLVDSLRGAAGLADLDVVTDDQGNVGVQAGTYLQDNVYLGVTAGANGQSKVTINLDVTEDLTIKGAAGQDGNSSLGVFFEKDY